MGLGPGEEGAGSGRGGQCGLEHRAGEAVLDLWSAGKAEVRWRVGMSESVIRGGCRGGGMSGWGHQQRAHWPLCFTGLLLVPWKCFNSLH